MVEMSLDLRGGWWEVVDSCVDTRQMGDIGHTAMEEEHPLAEVGRMRMGCAAHRTH
jgi:hypothetical protein